MHLRTKILLGLVLGAAAGIVSQIPGVPLLRDGLILIEPFGEAFIRLITMVVVPLVVGSLFVGTASVGDVRRLERLGGRTLGFFLVSTVIAATIGLVLGLLGRPGVGMDPTVRDALSAEFQGASTDAATAAAETAPGLVQIVVEMIPMNPFEAAAEMDLLPLIIAVVIFGAAANLVVEESRQHLLGFFRGVNDLSMVVIGWVMKLAPYAVFALIGSVVARFGTELLESLLFYSALVVAGLLIHALGVLGLALRVLANTGIGSFYRSISDAAVLAFSTSSSNATLPVSMEVAEEKLGIDESVASFVLPLGATLNMNGSALYKALTAVFVAQVYGLALTPAVVLTIVVTATLAAMAGAGVPGSSLVTTLIVLNAIGLGPQAAAGIALVLGMDRILDMARTTVNVVGDLTCAAYISRFDGSGTAPAGSEFG